MKHMRLILLLMICISSGCANTPAPNWKRFWFDSIIETLISPLGSDSKIDRLDENYGFTEENNAQRRIAQERQADEEQCEHPQ